MTESSNASRGREVPLTAAASVASCRALRDRMRAFVEIPEVPLPVAPGPLGGIPIAIKDMIDVAGRAPTLGLQHAPRDIPTQNARLVNILSDGGAAIVAFAQMSPLAFEPSGANPLCGRPLNPWNEDYICGGSSSGSAVAVATDCVALALGSDTAGSLRIPAHCCGITAWKPTYGLVPIEGTMPLAPSLDTIGFLARAASTIAPVADLFTNIEKPQSIRRVAVAYDLSQRSAASIQISVTAMERILLAIECSLASVALGPLLVATDAPVLSLLAGEAARANADLIGSDVLDHELRTRLRKGLAISDAQLDDARRLLERLAAIEIERLFSATDAILLPVMPLSTPQVASCEPSGRAFAPRTLYALSSFTRFINALGLPAISIPAGVDENGLPIGVQMIGPPGSDRALIALACEVQLASNWHSRRPPQKADKSNS